MRILKDDCIGLIIDIQERLLPHMTEPEQLLQRNGILVQGLQTLEVPILVTEQYTKGLGFTVEPIKNLFEVFQSQEKIAFSCVDDESIARKLQSSLKKFVIIGGIEAHVCVMQTAMDLLTKGFVPVIVDDCISSRKEMDKRIALKRMERSGAIIVSSESILFELTRFAGTGTFKSISKLVK